MKLKELYASNFKTLNFDSALRFTDGVTLVVGKNESGKSTILDAMLYALFGKVIKPRVNPKKEDIIRFTQKKAFVRLDFAIDDKEYRVERTVHLGSTSTKAILFEKQSKGFEPISTSVKEVNSKIEEILSGITYQEIVASNIVAQKDLSHLIDKSSTDRKNIINIFLNLNSYNKASDDFKGEINDIKGTRARKGSLTAEQEMLSELKSQLEDYNAKVNELNDIKKKIKKLKPELKSKKAEHKKSNDLYKLLENYNKANSHKESLQTQIKEREKLKTNIKKQLDDLNKKEKKLNGLKKKLIGFEDFESTKLEMDNGQSYIDNSRDLKTRESNRKQDKETQEQEIKELKTKIPEDKIINRIQKLSKALPYSVLTTLALLVAGIIFTLVNPGLVGYLLLGLSTLPLILSVYIYLKKRQLKESLETKERIDRIQVQVDNYNNELQNIRKIKNNNKKEFTVFLQGITRYKSLFIEKKEPEAIFAEMKKSCAKDDKELTKIKTEIKGLTDDVSQKQQISSNFKRTNEELKTIKIELADIVLPTLPEGVKFSQKKLSDTKENVDNCRDRITTLETTIKERESRKGQLEEQIEANKDIETRCKEQEKVVNVLKRNLSILELAREGIETTTHLLRERVRPNVQSYMSSFLPAITSNKYRAVQIDENYNLSVWDPGAGMFKERNIFSGGTEDQFLLSMRLAFALALLPEAKGSYPNFLFLDEPLSSSDSIRRENIVNLINTNLSQRFNQIILISHISESEFEMIIDNVIRMEDGRLAR